MNILPDYNRLNWIQDSLQIIDKRGNLRPLVPNNGQLLLHAELQQQRMRDLPVRIVLLKPRRVGWSTWSEAEAFHDIHHNPNWAAMAVSMDADSTDTIFAMTKRFQRYLPDSRPTDNTNKKQIVFSDPHNSVFHAQTAGKVGVGRSFTAQFLHCSEVAFWADAKTQLAGLYQIVDDSPGTVIILESTANGIGGSFYDKYWQAKDHQKLFPEDFREYRPVFFSWFDFPEYVLTPPEWFERTEEEDELVSLYNLTDEQLYWRRVKIAELDDDLSLFKQEYPCTDLEAFQSSGNPVFTPAQISSQEKHLVDCRTAVFREDEIDDVNRSFNCWFLANVPIPGREYSMGIDTMEGRISDIADPKSKLDCHGIVVMDRATGEWVAVYHGQGGQDELGEQAYWCARYFNDAFVGVEMPQGMVVLKYFVDRGYSNLYNRQTHDESLSPTDSEAFGWRTTIVTRDWMVNDFITAIRSNAVKIRQEIAIEEMKTFIRDKTGKAIHMPGKKDDVLFGGMIALQIHKRCPLSGLGNQTHTTGFEVEYENMDKLAYAGAIDYGTERDFDDDWYYHTV
jgi:hypothetical protein